MTQLRDLVKERDDAAKSCFAALDKWTARIAKDWKKPCDPKLAAQKKLLAELDDLATACRDLVKDVDLVFKLVARVVDVLGTQREHLLSPALSSIPNGGEGEELGTAERTSKLPRPAKNER